MSKLHALIAAATLGLGLAGCAADGEAGVWACRTSGPFDCSGVITARPAFALVGTDRGHGRARIG